MHITEGANLIQMQSRNRLSEVDIRWRFRLSLRKPVIESTELTTKLGPTLDCLQSLISRMQKSIMVWSSCDSSRIPHRRSISCRAEVTGSTWEVTTTVATNGRHLHIVSSHKPSWGGRKRIKIKCHECDEEQGQGHNYLSRPA